MDGILILRIIHQGFQGTTQPLHGAWWTLNWGLPLGIYSQTHTHTNTHTHTHPNTTHKQTHTQTQTHKHDVLNRLSNYVCLGNCKTRRPVCEMHTIHGETSQRKDNSTYTLKPGLILHCWLMVRYNEFLLTDISTTKRENRRFRPFPWP